MPAKVSTNTKLLIAASSVVLLVGGVYVVGKQFPPRNADISGTIAPAQR